MSLGASGTGKFHGHGVHSFCDDLAGRPAFLFPAKQLREGVNDQEALLIGIKCERGSHKFFKKYGERFEDSEGKQVFLEFAEEEKAHLELLLREYRVIREREEKAPARAGSSRRAAKRR